MGAEGDDVTHLQSSHVYQVRPQHQFDFYQTEKQGRDSAAQQTKLNDIWCSCVFLNCVCCSVHSFDLEHGGKASRSGLLRLLLHASSANGWTSFRPGHPAQLYH